MTHPTRSPAPALPPALASRADVERATEHPVIARVRSLLADYDDTTSDPTQARDIAEADFLYDLGQG